MSRVIIISCMFGISSRALAGFGGDSHQWQSQGQMYDMNGNPHFHQNSYHHARDTYSNDDYIGQAIPGPSTGYQGDWSHANYHPMQHMDEENSYQPEVRNIGIPTAYPVSIPIPHVMAQGVPQPYPVHYPVTQYVQIPVIKTIAVPVEKKVPYAIEKIVPVPVEKPVPISIEKYIPVPVEKPYPIHIPIYRHIFHKSHVQSRANKYGRW